MGNSRVLQDADNQVNSGFGWRASTNSFHEGDDLVKYSGQIAPVIAHSDGVVESTVRNIPGYLKNSYGNEIVIKHNAREKTHYAHLKYNTITVLPGQQVKKGDVIGVMGKTGNTDAIHLHFEYILDGKKVDPIGIIGADLLGGTSLLVIDGGWGYKTTVALQTFLGVAADGNFGPMSTKALQHILGVREDGVFGPISKKALQRRLGVPESGIMDVVTVKALQTALNNGSL